MPTPNHPTAMTPLDHQARKELNETNDCTVIATMHVAQMHYSEAHRVCASVGRKPRKGCSFHRVAQQLGLRKMWLCSGTVRSVLPQLDKGRFVIRVSGHVIPVVDGQIKDWVSPQSLRSEGVLDDIRDLRRYLLLVEAEWGTPPLTSCSHPTNKVIVTATTATCMNCSTELSLPRSSAQEDCDHPRLGRVIGNWCVCFECGLWVTHAATPVQAEE